MHDIKTYKIIKEITEETTYIFNNKNRVTRTTYYLIETLYGLCKISKKSYHKDKILTILFALNKTEFFQNESNFKFNNEFEILSPYIKNNQYIKIRHKICNTTYQQDPSSHLRGKGCPTCNGVAWQTQEQVIEKANTVHNFRYTYLNFKFKNVGCKSTITCPIHGDFEQKVQSHLEGHGCYKCARELNINSKTSFIQYCKTKNNKAIFYIIKCFNKTETFYKLGITSNSIEKRYCNNTAMPYQYEIIQEIKGIPEDIWNLELFFKHYITKNNFKYYPSITFNGSITECFKS